jgi:hypothetical protein
MRNPWQNSSKTRKNFSHRTCARKLYFAKINSHTKNSHILFVSKFYAWCAERAKSDVLPARFRVKSDESDRLLVLRSAQIRSHLIQLDELMAAHFDAASASHPVLEPAFLSSLPKPIDLSIERRIRALVAALRRLCTPASLGASPEAIASAAAAHQAVDDVGPDEAAMAPIRRELDHQTREQKSHAVRASAPLHDSSAALSSSSSLSFASNPSGTANDAVDDAAAWRAWLLSSTRAAVAADVNAILLSETADAARPKPVTMRRSASDHGARAPLNASTLSHALDAQAPIPAAPLSSSLSTHDRAVANNACKQCGGCPASRSQLRSVSASSALHFSNATFSSASASGSAPAMFVGTRFGPPPKTARVSTSATPSSSAAVQRVMRSLSARKSQPAVRDRSASAERVRNRSSARATEARVSGSGNRGDRRCSLCGALVDDDDATDPEQRHVAGRAQKKKTSAGAFANKQVKKHSNHSISSTPHAISGDEKRRDPASTTHDLNDDVRQLLSTLQSSSQRVASLAEAANTDSNFRVSASSLSSSSATSGSLKSERLMAAKDTMSTHVSFKFDPPPPPPPPPQPSLSPAQSPSRVSAGASNKQLVAPQVALPPRVLESTAHPSPSSLASSSQAQSPSSSTLISAEMHRLRASNEQLNERIAALERFVPRASALPISPPKEKSSSPASPSSSRASTLAIAANHPSKDSAHHQSENQNSANANLPHQTTKADSRPHAALISTPRPHAHVTAVVDSAFSTPIGTPKASVQFASAAALPPRSPAAHAGGSMVFRPKPPPAKPSTPAHSSQPYHASADANELLSPHLQPSVTSSGGGGLRSRRVVSPSPMAIQSSEFLLGAQVAAADARETSTSVPAPSPSEPSASSSLSDQVDATLASMQQSLVADAQRLERISNEERTRVRAQTVTHAQLYQHRWGEMPLPSAEEEFDNEDMEQCDQGRALQDEGHGGNDATYRNWLLEGAIQRLQPTLPLHHTEPQQPRGQVELHAASQQIPIAAAATAVNVAHHSAHSAASFGIAPRPFDADFESPSEAAAAVWSAERGNDAVDDANAAVFYHAEAMSRNQQQQLFSARSNGADRNALSAALPLASAAAAEFSAPSLDETMPHHDNAAPEPPFSSFLLSPSSIPSFGSAVHAPVHLHQYRHASAISDNQWDQARHQRHLFASSPTVNDAASTSAVSSSTFHPHGMLSPAGAAASRLMGDLSSLDERIAALRTMLH